MSSWNYRVVRKRTATGEIVFGIHEVYYDGSGNPAFCSDGSIEPGGESIRDLRANLTNMLKALNKPILKFEDF